MLLGHIRTTLRNLRRHPGYMIMNVSGLAVGLACCIVILLFVQSEMSVDTFHEKTDRIVRVWAESRLGPEPRYLGHSVHPLAEFAEDNYPEVESSTHLLSSISNARVRRGDRVDYEKKVWAADPEFFGIFDFRFVEGTAESALSEPYRIVMTPAFAERYFGREYPVGQEIMMTYSGEELPFTVSGIVEPPPANTRFDYEAVISYSTYVQFYEDFFESDITDQWGRMNPETYLLLRGDADWRELEAKLSPAVTEYVSSEGFVDSEEDIWYTYFLQPLSDIHLGRLGLKIEAEGNLQTIRMFSLIALLILMIACVNYMNLATARGARRAREVGVRKAFGARRGQLAIQFLTEAIALTLIGLVLAVLIVEAVVPLVNDLAGERVITGSWYDLTSAGWLMALAVVAGLLAGSYPALVLTRYRPGIVLRGGGTTTAAGNSFLRRSLVVAQFAGGIGLIIATVVIREQLEYVRTTDLGYDREHVVSVPLREAETQDLSTTLSDQLVRVPGVVSVSVASDIPNGIGQGHGVKALANPDDEGAAQRVLTVDSGFDDVLDLEVVDGRWFERDRPADANAYVVNEAAVREFGVPELIGTELDRNGNVGPVIGVVRDFHHASLHQEIEPLVLFQGDSRWDRREILLRLAGTDIQSTLSDVADVWNEVVPTAPFSFTFLDEEIDRLYAEEQRLGRLFGLFAGLGIFVACLGLFGLAAFTAQQRTKEIGVRKVLGATVASIVVLLSGDFVRLVGLAFVLAAPVVWIVMQSWLDGFAFHIEPGASLFVVPALLALVIAVVTVSGQAVRAALSNPVDSLRNE